MGLDFDDFFALSTLFVCCRTFLMALLQRRMASEAFMMKGCNAAALDFL